MSETTAIEWTNKTWNPWHGCKKVSPGCAHCYMFRDKKRYGQDPTIVTRSKTTFKAPLRWKDPALVFTCSWSDWFIEAADEWRAEAWDIIRRTPHLNYQILTKRPERILECLPEYWEDIYHQVWLGVSVEDQQRANERIPILDDLGVPVEVKFLSCEPLLGPIDFKQIETPGRFGTPQKWWVIVGGESGGPEARPMHPDWVRSIRDQCAAAEVPFFFKQWGEYCAPSQMTEAAYRAWDYHHGTENCWNPDDPRWRIGKKAAGRLLDGKIHNEFPKEAT